MFSNNPEMWKLLWCWTWMQIESVSGLKKKLQRIREATYLFISDLQNFPNVNLCFRDGDKPFHGCMFRFEPSFELHPLSDQWQTSVVNLGTRFVHFEYVKF